MDDYLEHYGMPRRSGRYPWGSGENPYQSAIGWRAHIQALKNEGFSETQIAEFEGITTTQLRARNSLTSAEVRAQDRARALTMKERGYSNMEIARRMSDDSKTWNESSVRSLLDPVLAERASITRTVASALEDEVAEKRYIDIGVGVENHIGVSRTKLNMAVAELEEQGYKVHRVNVSQVGVPGQFTVFKVLGAPDTEWKELVNNTDLIQNISRISDDYGRTFTKEAVFDAKKIKDVSLNRVDVRYAEEGGSDKDGVIEIRRGVDDLDLGGSQYAQVRISVDGTHFLKGMAMYNDNLPDGTDIIFNTNKHDTGNKLDAMKKMKRDNEGNLDPDNPFGATIKEGGQRGAINIVNEEGDWDKWSKNISSQVLSKQSTPLAKKQLELAYSHKKEEYDEISALTNPVVKKQLLMAFADDCDASSVHLKAAALPRQASKVILPVPELKENEVYAPSFNNGETVALIRHPHGGTFEIPELTVNNKSKAARSVMENAKDAIGIHPKVAERLSGADFDGDTVIVIPNDSGSIRSSPPLRALKNFDPIETYPPYDGMKTIDGGIYNAKTREVDYGGSKPKSQTKQTKMGEVSNLITDMTIKGATPSELARAVKHSMVVIDSEKHHLNYKLSYEENNIASLAEKYQNSKRGGASTLVSKASSEERVLARKPRSAKDGGPIDPATGKKVYTPTDESYVDRKGKTIFRTVSSTKMAETDDARTLSSGRPMEELYATYANALKALANTSRRDALATHPTPYNASARKTYATEVQTLNSQLSIAKMNKPLERQAQVLANSEVARRRQAHPDMDKDDIKKVKNQALAKARVRTGADKILINITDREWEAIQAGAISPSNLSQILQNVDLDRVKQLATPRVVPTMTSSMKARARTMIASGATLAEVAETLGVSSSTVSNALE